jgi:hypothetical protein
MPLWTANKIKKERRDTNTSGKSVKFHDKPGQVVEQILDASYLGIELEHSTGHGVITEDGVLEFGTENLEVNRQNHVLHALVILLPKVAESLSNWIFLCRLSNHDNHINKVRVFQQMLAENIVVIFRHLVLKIEKTSKGDNKVVGLLESEPK